MPFSKNYFPPMFLHVGCDGSISGCGLGSGFFYASLIPGHKKRTAVTWGMLALPIEEGRNPKTKPNHISTFKASVRA